MNYEKIYEKLIESRKKLNRSQKKNDEYFFDKHHIIPRCINGSNNLDNLILLTPKEHFFAHLLLCKIYEQRLLNEPQIKPCLIKLSHAFFGMCNGFQHKNHGIKQYVSSSKMYAEAVRIKRAAGYSDESRLKMSNSHKGKKLSDEHKKNIGIASRNRSVETKNKLSLAHKGKKQNPLHIYNKSLANIGKHTPSEETLTKMRKPKSEKHVLAMKNAFKTRVRKKTETHIEIVQILCGYPDMNIDTWLDITNKISNNEKITNDIIGENNRIRPTIKRKIKVKAKINGIEIEKTFQEKQRIVLRKSMLPKTISC